MKHHKRVIALVADTHTGSKYALFPPRYKDEEGNVYKANRGQRQIYEYWRDFCGICNDLRVDTVFHLGDALHGTNKKEYGRGLMFSDLDVQKDVCETLLRPLVRDRKFYIISGSGYHESLDSRVHIDIAKRLKGKYLGALSNVRLRPSNRIVNVSHGQSGAAIYRTTVMDREGHLILQSQSLDKLPKIDIVVRGHWHSFIHIHLAQQHLIQLPCWMAWEPSRPYLRYYGKMQADIGGVILMIDNKDRINVWHYLYPLPHIADYVRNG